MNDSSDILDSFTHEADLTVAAGVDHDSTGGSASDAALIHAVQQGDYQSFDLLQMRLQPQVERFVRRLVGDGEVDDLVQDVFIALFKNIHSIDPPEKLRPFLFRVARNRCYDELRRRGRYDYVGIDDEPLENRISLYHDASQRPEDAAHWLLLNLEVREAMDRLPELQRQSLILYAEEEMTYAEIGEVMGCSAGTVKSRVHYAKKTLRALLPASVIAVLDAEFSGEGDPYAHDLSR